MMFEQPKREVDRVFLHCTASDGPWTGDNLRREITEWHNARGFAGIGYHFLIDKMGDTMEGRPLNRIPAAQRGHNHRSIAISVHGLTHFTDASFEALLSLCSQINLAYSGRVSFHGHCEVSRKSCPVFDYKDGLQLDRFGRMP